MAAAPGSLSLCNGDKAASAAKHRREVAEGMEQGTTGLAA